ncbi:conserved hypothetical protein, partial [Ricinus communis]
MPAPQPALSTAPESLAEAQALLAQLHDELRQREQKLAQREQHIQSLELKNQKLVLELAQLKRLRFGKKSEALSVEQKALFEDDVDQDLAAIAAELDPAVVETTTASPSKRARAGRQPLPAHLERVEVRHEPESCTC